MRGRARGGERWIAIVVDISATTDGSPELAGGQPRGGPGARRLVGSAGVGVIVSGLLINVYLAVVARALTPAEYATFGAFWALALVLGFGPFLPLEQELARRLSLRESRRQVLVAGAATAAVLGVLALVVLAAASPLVWSSLDAHPWAFAALVALCLVSAGQFLLRGLLIGTDRLVRHGAVMVLDAVAAPRPRGRAARRPAATRPRTTAGRSSRRSRSPTSR